MSNEIEEKILVELQKIRAAVEPPKAPDVVETKKSFLNEFMGFLSKYGVIGLAIGFIIGGAAGALVSALVADILMPVITFFIPGGGWRDAILALGPIQLSLGHFVGVLLDFLVIALIVFILMKQITKIGLK